VFGDKRADSHITRAEGESFNVSHCIQGYLVWSVGDGALAAETRFPCRAALHKTQRCVGGCVVFRSPFFVLFVIFQKMRPENNNVTSNWL
jgi:hypothetical protein